MKQKIELQTKSRSQQQTKKSKSSQSPQYQQFNFSGIIESKYLQRISSQLQRNTGQHDDIGLPTSLTASSKFIAIGTQRGIILVFDLFEELRQELGSKRGEEFFVDKVGSVSSITLSSNGEHLIAGYANGDIILWDIIKGQMVKRVADIHISPITVVRFVSENNF
jgi:WD40 repeat protein